MKRWRITELLIYIGQGMRRNNGNCVKVWEDTAMLVRITFSAIKRMRTERKWYIPRRVERHASPSSVYPASFPRQNHPARISEEMAGYPPGQSVAAAKCPLPLTSFRNVFLQTSRWRMKLWRLGCQKHSIALLPICRLRKGRFSSAVIGIWIQSSRSVQIFVLVPVSKIHAPQDKG